MKKCRSCQKEIDSKATKCPFCQEKQGNWAKRHPILTGIIAIFVFFFVISAVSGGGDSNSSGQSNTSLPAAEVVGTVDDTTDTPGETLAQKNAVRKAVSYLSFTGFSRDGLVKQLEFDEFSSEDAVYGADHVGADWNEQAAKKAQSYLDTMAFSRDGLINQLKFDGFTTEQATYGVDVVGL